MIEEKSGYSNNELKTSKGYRLKLSTHAMIKSLQELTGNDADNIITQSCILLYKQIIENKEKNKSIINNITPKEDL